MKQNEYNPEDPEAKKGRDLGDKAEIGEKAEREFFEEMCARLEAAGVIEIVKDELGQPVRSRNGQFFYQRKSGKSLSELKEIYDAVFAGAHEKAITTFWKKKADLN